MLPFNFFLNHRYNMAQPLDILLVDDDPMIVQILELFLEAMGHAARSCTAPLDAVDLMAAQKFDLVLSDRSMPVMSGDELALRVREMSPGTRFVMISGDADMMIANGEMPDAVDMIIGKPVSGEGLRETLESLYPEIGGDNAVALSG